MSQVTVAVVSGAGGVLGHATATALAARGLTVIALDPERTSGELSFPGPGAGYTGAVTAEPRLPSTPSCVSVIVPSG
jgi:NAD(P)-dependent dehydrogenase (short-subunit alcohol dehydrogenase family)